MFLSFVLSDFSCWGNFCYVFFYNFILSNFRVWIATPQLSGSCNEAQLSSSLSRALMWSPHD